MFFQTNNIKNIVYIHCQRWVTKLSLKDAFGEYFHLLGYFLCHKKKIVLCEKTDFMHRESSILYFVVLINEVKKFWKKYQCSAQMKY